MEQSVALCKRGQTPVVCCMGEKANEDNILILFSAYYLEFSQERGSLYKNNNCVRISNFIIISTEYYLMQKIKVRVFLSSESL